MSASHEYIFAGAAADARGGTRRSVLVELTDGRITDVRQQPSTGPAERNRRNASTANDSTVSGAVTRIERPGHLLLPALVNAHAHLDLSHLGPRSYSGDFREWIELIRSERRTEDDAIAEAVRQGLELARAGGTGAVGDIAGMASFAPGRAMREAGMPGVSFLELFGIGRSEASVPETLRRLRAQIDEEDEAGRTRFGLQPHAPYSCSLATFARAAATGLPLATHLAETPAEVEFTAAGTGPFREMLESFGLWEESIRVSGHPPVRHLMEVLRAQPALLAHVNYAERAELELLASTGCRVVYCPRATAYFGHHGEGRTEHRYREMLDLGLPVALGTDSLVCLDTPDRIGVLDEMRLLYRRDRTDPHRLLTMATTHGANALGLKPSAATLQPGAGATLGIIALPFDVNDARDPLAQVLLRDEAPEWIVGPTDRAEFFATAPVRAAPGSGDEPSPDRPRNLSS